MNEESQTSLSDSSNLQLQLEESKKELEKYKKELNSSKEKIQQLSNQVKEISEEKDSNLNQFQQIIDNQNKIIDYFIPTEEEIKKQEEQEKKLQEETKKEEEKLAEELKEKEELQEKRTVDNIEYQQELLAQVKMLNDNIYKVEFQAQNTNSYMYILCLMLLATSVCVFIYKMIKKFMQY